MNLYDKKKEHVRYFFYILKPCKMIKRNPYVLVFIFILYFTQVIAKWLKPTTYILVIVNYCPLISYLKIKLAS